VVQQASGECALMRPHGRAHIDPRSPRALAICDRCQEMVNHGALRWQMRWRGPAMQSIRLLVCPACYDTPNEQERTFVLPIDPDTIRDARPENYARDDNPASPLGLAANDDNPASPLTLAAAGIAGNIGTLNTLDAAFDGAVVYISTSGATPRRFPFCANLTASATAFGNTVGKNWAAEPSGVLISTPSTVSPLTHIVASFTLIAPSDQSFLQSGATAFHLDGSANGVTWSTIYSGTTAGTAREVVTATTTSQAPFQYHRVDFQGDGTPLGVAQVILNISDAGQNEV